MAPSTLSHQVSSGVTDRSIILLSEVETEVLRSLRKQPEGWDNGHAHYPHDIAEGVNTPPFAPQIHSSPEQFKKAQINLISDTPI